MNRLHTLRIKADLKELDRMRRFVEERAAALQVESSDMYDVLLAVNEMVTNIIVHGYHGEAGSIEVGVESEGSDLITRLRDWAPAFDPTSVPPPDITLPLHMRPLGGMGIHLTRKLMDSIDYRADESNGNELILVKRGAVAPHT
jgi:serine/threonine-protein kinase RsbW